MCGLTGGFTTIGYYDRYWVFSSVQVFIGVAVFIVLWVCSTWWKILLARRKQGSKIGAVPRTLSKLSGTVLYTATVLVCWWILISIKPRYEAQIPMLKGNGDKYFIAISLHNNEGIMAAFTRDLTSLARYSEYPHDALSSSLTAVGPEQVFISIYESNSFDSTGTLLAEYRELLDHIGIPNRILPMMRDEGGGWPYSTSPQRIAYLAKMRNKVMEPIQSADPDLRLPDWNEFTKLIFLNDIRFDWKDIVRLIATRVDGKEDEDYDVACAMDFGRFGKSFLLRASES